MKHFIRYAGLCTLLMLTLAFNAGAQDVYTSSGRKLGAPKRQEKKKGFDPQRLVIGAGIVGLQFADNYFSIGAAPIVGYRFTDKFAAGVGLGFQYLSVKDYYQFYNSSTGAEEYHPLHVTFYYPSLWGRYIIYRNFFAQAELEYDMQHATEWGLDVNNYPTKVTEQINSPALLLGGGLRQPVSDRSSLFLMALYDVIQNENSPYKNGLDFRIGFNLGF